MYRLGCNPHYAPTVISLSLSHSAKRVTATVAVDAPHNTPTPQNVVNVKERRSDNGWPKGHGSSPRLLIPP